MSQPSDHSEAVQERDPPLTAGFWGQKVPLVAHTSCCHEPLDRTLESWHSLRARDPEYSQSRVPARHATKALHQDQKDKFLLSLPLPVGSEQERRRVARESSSPSDDLPFSSSCPSPTRGCGKWLLFPLHHWEGGVGEWVEAWAWMSSAGSQSCLCCVMLGKHLPLSVWLT